jgi:hypothetical protein
MEWIELRVAAACLGLGWLFGAWFLMGRSVRRGQRLARDLETRHPRTYEAAERPRPGYLPSVRRRAFASFVAQRKYEDLGDPPLEARFERFRRAEARLVVSLLVALVALLLLAYTTQALP